MGVSTSYSKAESDIKDQNLKKLFASGLNSKPLKIADPTPTVVGGYYLKEVGTYPNGLTTVSGKLNIGFFFNGSWELLSIDMPKNTDFATSKPNSISFDVVDGEWHLITTSQSILFGNNSISKTSAPAQDITLISDFSYIYGNLVTGEIWVYNSSQSSTDLIFLGLVYPQFELFSMRIPFVVNGKPNNIDIGFEYQKENFIVTKPEFFNIIKEGNVWKVNLLVNSFAFGESDTPILVGPAAVQTLSLDQPVYNHIHFNKVTGLFENYPATFAAGSEAGNERILVAVVAPEYNLFYSKCPYAVNGKPYNIPVPELPIIDIPSDIDPTVNDLLDKYADVNHLINYGQSLSVGQTEVVLTTQALFPQLVNFDGVTRTSAYDKALTGEIYPTNRRLALVPNKERQDDGGIANGQLRETPTSGTLESLALEINKKSRVKFPQLPMMLLGSAPGWGATTIAQLSKGGQYYAQLIADVNAGKSISNTQNKVYKVLAVTWTQGESDYLNGTTQVQYKSALLQLRNDLNTDIKAITGQSEDIAFVMYQTATSNIGGQSFPSIALAQFELASTEPGFYMATPMYFFQHNDGFHINSKSTKLLGAYYGLAISKIIQGNFKGLKPDRAILQGNIIKLKFEVPRPPLRFQAANAVTLPKKGFAVMKNGADILNSVAIGGDGLSVNLMCSENPAGAKIEYGINATPIPNSTVNLGNLSDSQGDNQGFEIQGVNLRMDNWSPIFEMSVI